jgi:hypothetical protein
VSKYGKKIEIINPLPGGMAFTSLTRARFFVERGLASMQDGKLRFFESAQPLDLPTQPEGCQPKMHVWAGSSRRRDAMLLPGMKRS